jgi:histidine ammonia-lyase
MSTKIDPETLHTVYEVYQSSLAGDISLEIAPATYAQMERSRTYLDTAMADSDAVYYGINTGFGSLCNTRIPASDLTTLQENLIRSHACGVGRLVEEPLVRTMQLLKIKNLVLGYSAVSRATIDAMLAMFNNRLHGVVYEMGSLGASGDLSPLAHIALPLIGEGLVYEHGKPVEVSSLASSYKLAPVRLECKEGLALLNGTQFMCAYGVHLVAETNAIFSLVHCLSALSVSVWYGRHEPFHPALHRVRNQNGQAYIAAKVLKWLGDGGGQHTSSRVQDPYSFRCIPQVHGASWGVLEHVQQVVETEINSVTDNPTVFVEENLILSGGNFHGQPLALAFDYLALALSELGSISERRTYQLLSGPEGLPPFLANNPGVESGLMIPQYTAAGLASQNKQLCTPASADSITSSNGQEDHVSMGANGALKAWQILKNLRSILSIEWLTACQATRYRPKGTLSPTLQAEVDRYLEAVPQSLNDKFMAPIIAATDNYLQKRFIYER